MSGLAVVAHNEVTVPALIAGAGKPAAQRFLEFFTVNIRNPNTRAAYGRAAGAFLRWCEGRGVTERAARGAIRTRCRLYRGVGPYARAAPR